MRESKNEIVARDGYLFVEKVSARVLGYITRVIITSKVKEVICELLLRKTF